MTDKANAEILDRLKVSDIVTRFYFHLDMYEWDELRALMDDEVNMSMAGISPDTSLIPLDQYMENTIARNAGYSLGSSGTFHGDFNHMIDLDGDSARVRCKCLAAHWLSEKLEDHGPMLGIYDVILKRRTAGWKIQRVTITPLRMDGDAGRIISTAAKAWAEHVGS